MADEHYLILRPRGKPRKQELRCPHCGEVVIEKEHATWHDSAILLNGSAAVIAAKRNTSDALMWLQLSSKIQEAMDEVEDFEDTLPEIRIRLSSTQYKHLYSGMKQIEPNSWGRRVVVVNGNPQVEKALPSAAFLYEMLQDFAEQLGETFEAGVGSEGE